MELNVKCFGNIVKESTKQSKLVENVTLKFDYLDENIIINIEEVNDEFYVVKLNRQFCLEENETINLLQTNNTFKFSIYDENIICLPLYDAIYKLKFSVIKEKI